MPIFDYLCPRCGKEEERIVKQGQQDDQECECGNKLNKQLGVHTKHGSWSSWAIGLPNSNRGR